jgi:hypothetical protein
VAVVSGSIEPADRDRGSRAVLKPGERPQRVALRADDDGGDGAPAD